MHVVCACGWLGGCACVVYTFKNIVRPDIGNVARDIEFI